MVSEHVGSKNDMLYLIFIKDKEFCGLQKHFSGSFYMF